MDAATTTSQVVVGTAVFSQSRGWCRVTSVDTDDRVWLEPDNGREGFYVSVEGHITTGWICDR